MRNFDTALIIPAYNEEKVITETIKSISLKNTLVICINDGSKDKTSKLINDNTSAVLVEHPINMGQGAAIQTGIDYALQFPEIKYFVTFDADGQHDINDVKIMLKTLKNENLDVVLGSRFLGVAHNISRRKKLFLKGAVKFTNNFSKVNLTDTHNGLRVFNRYFAESVDIKMSSMAHASEIIDKLGRGDWAYKEVPVTIHYTDYSKAKGQSIMNSLNILFDLVIERSVKK